MELALEFLDFMNFRLGDDAHFRKALDSKLLSLEAYDRISNCKKDVVKRSRQLIDEWMKAKRLKCEYSLEGAIHSYKAADKPGFLHVKLASDPKDMDVWVARSVDWASDWGISIKPVDPKMSLPLANLLESFPFWVEKRLPANELVKELKHYFSQFVFSDKPPYSFTGWPGFNGRLVGTYIKIDPGVRTSVYVGMKNERK